MFFCDLVLEVFGAESKKAGAKASPEGDDQRRSTDEGENPNHHCLRF